jgi:hypothetical protein
MPIRRRENSSAGSEFSSQLGQDGKTDVMSRPFVPAPGVTQSNNQFHGRHSPQPPVDNSPLLRIFSFFCFAADHLRFGFLCFGLDLFGRDSQLDALHDYRFRFTEDLGVLGNL